MKAIMENKKVIVIGIATGSNDLETWGFEDNDLCKQFCEQLVRQTGRRVYVIEGTVIGRYEIEEPHVLYVTKEKNPII